MITKIPDQPLLLAVPDADRLDDRLYDRLYSCATASRRTRTDRFLHREDACRSIVGEALVRLILREHNGMLLTDNMIVTNEFDCPSIPGAGFNYSISHSGAWVICAAAAGHVGADVERIHNVSEGIADRFFCPEETRYIDEGTDDAERQQRFFTLWVLKESYIKALGRGFNCPLSSFACLPGSSGSGWMLKRNDPALPEFYFSLHELPQSDLSLREPAGQKVVTLGHKCATCTAQPDRVPVLQVLTPSQLYAALNLP